MTINIMVIIFTKLILEHEYYVHCDLTLSYYNISYKSVVLNRKLVYLKRQMGFRPLEDLNDYFPVYLYSLHSAIYISIL